LKKLKLKSLKQKKNKGMKEKTPGFNL
jgi:hypothetical protein